MQTHVDQRSLSQYAPITGPDVLAELRRLAAPLAGLRILHLSASPYGSGVAETLAALVPLQRDLGLNAHWQWLPAPGEGQVWNRVYQGLAGERVRWGRRERRDWEAALHAQAPSLWRDHDVVVVHDPQLLGLPEAAGAPNGSTLWMWHSHLDMQQADAAVWADVSSGLDCYAAALFPSQELVPSRLPIVHKGVARPAIDPLAPRMRPVAASLAATILERLGVDPARPIVGQFAPIDLRYGPVGALGAYWLARQSVPGLQLVLVDASPARAEVTRPDEERVLQAAGDDPNVFIFTPRSGLGPTELSALQGVVSVALQMAVPRGFGWSVGEAQWRGKPAVVGQFGFLPEQVGWGKAGCVVDGAPGAAAALVRLLRDRSLAADFGRAGRARLVERHLITGLLGDYLLLLRRLLIGELTRSTWSLPALATYLDPAG